jgi:hypothetical protein
VCSVRLEARAPARGLVYRNASTAFLLVYRNASTAFLLVYRNASTAFLLAGDPGQVEAADVRSEPCVGFPGIAASAQRAEPIDLARGRFALSVGRTFGTKAHALSGMRNDGEAGPAAFDHDVTRSPRLGERRFLREHPR